MFKKCYEIKLLRSYRPSWCLFVLALAVFLAGCAKPLPALRNHLEIPPYTGDLKKLIIGEYALAVPRKLDTGFISGSFYVDETAENNSSHYPPGEDDVWPTLVADYLLAVWPWESNYGNEEKQADFERAWQNFSDDYRKNVPTPENNPRNIYVKENLKADKHFGRKARTLVYGMNGAPYECETLVLLPVHGTARVRVELLRDFNLRDESTPAAGIFKGLALSAAPGGDTVIYKGNQSPPGLAADFEPVSITLWEERDEGREIGRSLEFRTLISSRLPADPAKINTLEGLAYLNSWLYPSYEISRRIVKIDGIPFREMLVWPVHPMSGERSDTVVFSLNPAWRQSQAGAVPMSLVLAAHKDDYEEAAAMWKSILASIRRADGQEHKGKAGREKANKQTAGK